MTCNPSPRIVPNSENERFCARTDDPAPGRTIFPDSSVCSGGLSFVRDVLRQDETILQKDLTPLRRHRIVLYKCPAVPSSCSAILADVGRARCFFSPAPSSSKTSPLPFRKRPFRRRQLLHNDCHVLSYEEESAMSRRESLHGRNASRSLDHLAAIVAGPPRVSGLRQPVAAFPRPACWPFP